jgi:hypothetical protein
MATLGTALRKQLENTIRQAREVADEAAADAIERLAVAAQDAPAYLSDQQKALRRRLRAHARALGDRRDPGSGAMTTAQLAEAVAYEHWHRMLFGRFLVERNLLIHPKHGVPISRGDLKELAEEEGFADEWELVERFAAPTLPAVFKPDDPVLELELDPHFQLRLRRLVTELPQDVFASDDSLGWTYQFWRAAERKLVDQAVKETGIKIGSVELPAVTQLFTEPYMVKFLLHNTLGAWWAGKLLAANPDLARSAPDEDALRRACALPEVEWEYLRFVREEGEGNWRPGAGTFPGWPKRAAEITYCDPCCGSGHFLVEAFGMLAALRRVEEGLSFKEAARVVLRDNLYGLEIDGRCVQIAAFNIALAAWRLAGGPVDLPVLHIAWVGAPPPLPKSEFIALANGDAELQRGLGALHDLFRQAPLLGSLIGLTGGDLVDPTHVARIEQSIAALVDKMRGAEPELAEGALAARGMADAAAILSRRFTLEATNVPFLGRGKQRIDLAGHLKIRFDTAKSDLATAMLERMRRLAQPSGTVAAVMPQTWLYLKAYEALRRTMIGSSTFSVVVDLGPAAFQDMNWWAARTALVVLQNSKPAIRDAYLAIDADTGREFDRKSTVLQQGAPQLLRQQLQLKNPDARILTVAAGTGKRLSDVAISLQGIKTGDDAALRRSFWEVGVKLEHWKYLQTTVETTTAFGGLTDVVWWKEPAHTLARLQGLRAHGNLGCAVSQMGGLPAALYLGEPFDSNVSAVIPREKGHLSSIFVYLSSPEFRRDVRKLEPGSKANNGILVEAPFDLPRWQKAAAEKYPNGLPDPYSDDPTQWLFHGHPCYAEAGSELHVALARLAGYRWPAESDGEMRLSGRARAHVAEVASLPEADAYGLLPLVPMLGERPLADRLRTYCAAAWGEFWTPDSEAALIASACKRAKEKPPRQLTFDAWLRSHAARQHAKLFHDRPFLWWITDGRPDGFTAVSHYHRLDRANLERVAYSMLNDWIARQGDDPRAEAARILQDKLARILEGEEPYDIFVRWKPIDRQPLGWEPDPDDGVRISIRPFIEAKVLVHVPNVRYSVDRGKDVPSAPWYHVFNSKRRNDHHTTLAEKRAARAQAAE